MALVAALRARADQQRQDVALGQAVERDRQRRAERMAQNGAVERGTLDSSREAGTKRNLYAEPEEPRPVLRADGATGGHFWLQAF
jgi:hypothetical protein